MTIAKTELLIALLQARGAEIEDAKEAADREVQQALGALRALSTAQANLETRIPAAKQALMGAGCDLQQTEIGVKQVQLCVGSLISMVNTARVHGNKLQGRAELLAEQVHTLAKDVAREEDKLAEQKAAEASPPTAPVGRGGGAPGRRTSGVHPGPSLKTVRQSEAENGAGKKKTARKKRAPSKRKANGRVNA